MDRTLVNNAIRFFLLWALQVFLFKQIEWRWGGNVYLQFHLYPLFIILMPLRFPRVLVIFLSFLLGLSIDFFYETLGVHAAAATMTAYARALVFRILRPREGYNINNSPTKDYLGDEWFLRYAGIMLGIHLLTYFSVEAFTPWYILDILFKTIVSWLGSMLFLLIVVYLFNPKS